MFPNGTDLTFANKLKQHLNSNSCFRGDRGKAFSVSHYAGEVATYILYDMLIFVVLSVPDNQILFFYYQVVYDTSGFLEKNRDLLHMDSIQLLASCKSRLPKIFASNLLNQSEKVAGNMYRASPADSQKLSVATKFKVLFLTDWVIIFQQVHSNKAQLGHFYFNNFLQTCF